MLVFRSLTCGADTVIIQSTEVISGQFNMSGTVESVSVTHRTTSNHLALVRRCNTSLSLLFGCRQTAGSTDLAGTDASTLNEFG
ncbi:Hypothetical predicted protein [Scomber scombrus]|uniref:Uncharacterized protein n=1 Tax=Scomber scombrus TaxID=13677 RepID=A0AAV1MWT8_SCOSC